MRTNTVVSQAAIASVIRSRLDELDWTATQLSQEAGIVQSRMFRIVKGRSPIRLEEVAPIAKALGMEIEALLPGAES
jgi:predicted transcriptional regulator